MTFALDPRNPLEYAKVQLAVMPCVNVARAPLSTDAYLPLNTIWRVDKNPTTGVEGDQWICVKKTGSLSLGTLSATWRQFIFAAGPTGDIISLTGDDGTIVNGDASGNIDVLTSVVVTGTNATPVYSYSPGANILTLNVQYAGNPAASDPAQVGLAAFNAADFTVDSDGFVSLNGAAGIDWQVITASQTLAVNKGYICASPGGALSLALPATATLGDIIRVTLDGATSWTITQGAGQQIRFGNIQTTSGAGGSLASTAAGNTIHLVAQSATKWNVISALGTLNVV